MYPRLIVLGVCAAVFLAAALLTYRNIRKGEGLRTEIAEIKVNVRALSEQFETLENRLRSIELRSSPSPSPPSPPAASIPPRATFLPRTPPGYLRFPEAVERAMMGDGLRYDRYDPFSDRDQRATIEEPTKKKTTDIIRVP